MVIGVFGAFPFVVVVIPLGCIGWGDFAYAVW